MKTFSKTLDGPETEPQQITGHEFTNIDASEKVSSYLKRKLTFLVTLAITLRRIFNDCLRRRARIS